MCVRLEQQLQQRRGLGASAMFGTKSHLPLGTTHDQSQSQGWAWSYYLSQGTGIMITSYRAWG